MGDPAIRAVRLGKRYTLRHEVRRHPTLRDAITESVGKVVSGSWRRQRKEDFWALRDVSFEIQEGEAIGVIGRNGTGKSTLLKILSRITEPTEGEAQIRGKVRSLLEVGTGFHPELSGRENIFLNGAIMGMTRTDIVRKFDEIVAFAEIERFLDTPVKRYSSGMYIRLAFAVAAHLEPEILLVDEVLAVGDMEFQKKCLGKMSDVAAGGRTVLFVSHNMAAIGRLCRRGIYLDGGRVAFDGAVDGAIAAYLGGSTLDSITVENSGLTATISITDGDGTPIEAWAAGKDLLVTLSVHSKQPVKEPAVDLALYSGKGERLISLQSNLVNPESRISSSSGFRCRYRIANPGLAAGELRLDAGIRSGRDPEYLALWIGIAAIPVSARDLPQVSIAHSTLIPRVTAELETEEG